MARFLRREPRPSARVRRGRGAVVAHDVQLDVNAGARLVIGDGCRIAEHVRIAVAAGCVELGPGSVIGERCTLVAHAGIAIGARAVLGDGTAIVDFDHVFEDVERPIRAQPLKATAVTIGAGARIGFAASILRGVTIGAGAVVEPHAVVTRDVAPGARVGGVPARAIVTAAGDAGPAADDRA